MEGGRIKLVYGSPAGVTVRGARCPICGAELPEISVEVEDGWKELDRCPSCGARLFIGYFPDPVFSFLSLLKVLMAEPLESKRRGSVWERNVEIEAKAWHPEEPMDIRISQLSWTGREKRGLFLGAAIPAEAHPGQKNVK